MSLNGSRTFVGFGFGAIQTGLFLYEAGLSGAFGKLVVAEVVPSVVDAIRESEGFFHVNIARPDGVENARVGPVQIENPGDASDRVRLIQAIAEAEEIATAVPSVDFYSSQSPESLDKVLAEGLRNKAKNGGPRAVIYAAENNNHAAEILQSLVMNQVPEEERESVRAQTCFVNTVIGKMSGVVSEAEEIRERALVTVTPGDQRALLVEEFNRILISTVNFEEGSFERGLAVFEEKEDLLPFEEAKLFGHNATHALGAYVGSVNGLERLDQLRDLPGVLPFLRAAFIEESGAALVGKYAGLDPLFTHAGYQKYSDNLLQRMTNPHLGDAIERVGRDPKRKLGWSDRLVGTMRLARRQGVATPRFATGAAAALCQLDSQLIDKSASDDDAVRAALQSVWNGSERSETEECSIFEEVEAGVRCLRSWRDSGYRDLELLFL